MHTDGTGPRSGSRRRPPRPTAPAFSPDGRLVAFTRIAPATGPSSGSRTRTARRPAPAAPPTLGRRRARRARRRPGRRTGAGSPSTAAARRSTRIDLVRPDGSGRHVLVRGYEPGLVARRQAHRVHARRRQLGIWIVGADGRGARRLARTAARPPGRPTAAGSRSTKPPATAARPSSSSWTRTARHVRQLTHVREDRDGRLRLVARREADRVRGRAAATGDGLRLHDRASSGPTAAAAASCRAPTSSPATSPRGRPTAADRPRHGGYELRRAERRSGCAGRSPATAARRQHPRWSPDGRRILFSSSPGAVGDGRERRQPPPRSATSRRTAWSPDGRRIVGEDVEVDGDRRRSTSPAAARTDPGRRWRRRLDARADPAGRRRARSPTSTTAMRVALRLRPRIRRRRASASSGRERPRVVARRTAARLRGGGLDLGLRHRRRSAAGCWSANAFDAAFSPDGRRIAYVRDVTKTNTEIFVARSDGSGEKKITATRAPTSTPSWQPVR